MVAPDGFITYVSLIDTGNTHDSVSWNTALAWPPVEDNGSERLDRKSLLEQIQEFYGEGFSEEKRETVRKEKNPEGECGEKEKRESETETFALGADKAYPLILLPKGWSLFVTMTADEQEAIEEAREGNLQS